MYPPVDPIIFEFGPIALRWYGLLMVTAILSAVTVGASYLQRRGEDSDNLWDMLLWVIVPGFLGARLYYVFVQSPRNAAGIGRYLQNPAEILQFWNGGIHIFGGFLFGGLALWLYARWKQLPTLVYLDAIALGLPLGQAIGRWGNFINQELYGPPTTLPWGLRIDIRHRIPPYNNLGEYPDGTLFQPLFLYESLWNFLGFWVLWVLAKRFDRQLKPGDILLGYCIWYPLGRFWIEFLRTDSWFFAGTPFNTVHLLSALAVAVGVIGLYRRHFAGERA